MLVSYKQKFTVDVINYLSEFVIKNINHFSLPWTEAVVLRCSVKKVLLKIWQNSQENTCVRASFLIKLQV